MITGIPCCILCYVSHAVVSGTYPWVVLHIPFLGLIIRSYHGWGGNINVYLAS